MSRVASYTIFTSLIRSAADKCCAVGYNYDETTLACYTSKASALFVRNEIDYEINYASTTDEDLQEMMFDLDDPVPEGFEESLQALAVPVSYAYLLDIQTQTSFHPLWLMSVIPDYIERSQDDILEVENMLLVRIDDIALYSAQKQRCYRELEDMYKWYIPSALRTPRLRGLPNTSVNSSIESVSNITPLLFDKTSSMEVLLSILLEQPLVVRFSTDEILQKLFCSKYSVLSYFDGSFLVRVESYLDLLKLQADIFDTLNIKDNGTYISIELEYDVLEQAEFASYELSGVLHLHLREMRPYRVIGLISSDKVGEVDSIISVLKKR